MKVIIAILFVASALQAQTIRFDLNAHASNAVAAINLRNAVTNSLMGLAMAGDIRQRAISVRTNGAGSFSIDLSFFAADSNAAEAAWTNLRTNNPPAQTSGKLSVHYCPGDGKIVDWSGCADDPRSFYREVKW
jgi:hypothetical protein